MWRNVQDAVNKLTGDEKDNLPQIGRLPAHPLPAELTAGASEHDYQMKVHEVSQEVAKAHAARDQPALEEALKKSAELNMKAEFNKEVKEGERILSLMVQCTGKLDAGMSRCDIASLQSALELAQQFNYRTARVEAAEAALKVLVELSEARTLVNQDRLEAGLAETQSQGLDASTVPLVQAQELLDAIKACRAKAAEELARVADVRAAEGDSTLDYKALQAVRTHADKFGGLNSYDEVANVVSTLAQMDAEEVASLALGKALLSGGWLNPSTTHGDYASYQTADSIESDSLSAALASAQALNPTAAVTRQQVRQAELAVELRAAVKTAVGGKQDASLWAAVTTVLDKMGEFKSMATPPVEVTTAVEETQYQVAVAAHTTKVEAAIASHDDVELGVVIRQAEHVPMMPEHNECLPQAVALLSRITSTRATLAAAIQAVDEATLNAAIAAADEFSYTREEYAPAVALRDNIVAVDKEAQTAVQNMLEAELETVLEKAKAMKLHSESVAAAQRAYTTFLSDKGQWHTLQLASAQAAQDAARTLDLQGKLRTIALDKTRNEFSWPFAPALCESAEWARKQGISWNKSKVALGMHRYTEGSIACPLTKIELELSQNTPKALKELNKLCRLTFRDINLYLRPKPKTNPGPEVMPKLLAFMDLSPWHAKELYCMVMKQLTDCPYKLIRTRGWSLLGAMIRARPPVGEPMQFVVQKFCADKHSPERVQDLLTNVFAPPAEKPATLEAEAADLQTVPDHTGWDSADNVLASCCCCCA
jgi:hypothetical protein